MGRDPPLGRPDPAGAPAFDAHHQTPEAQAGQFGYNNDYLDIIETNRSGTSALLVCNHEYTNENIMFPPGSVPATVIRTAWAAHGMSVVELTRRKRGDAWTYVPGARLNRRITLDTLFAVDGPAAGSDLLKTKADPTGRTVRGTMNNCAGRYDAVGHGAVGRGELQPVLPRHRHRPRARPATASPPPRTSRNWRSVDPRWDATTADYANEPNRFGWIVEVDPTDPSLDAGQAHRDGPLQARGRQRDRQPRRPRRGLHGRRRALRLPLPLRLPRHLPPRQQRQGPTHNLHLLSEGDLSVARFTGDGLEDGVSDGTGEWIPLTRGGQSVVPGLHPRGGARLHAARRRRRAAHQDGPARGRRAEPAQRPHLRRLHQQHRPRQGRQGGPDRAQPAQRQQGRPRRRDHARRGGDHTVDTFTWNLFLICGDAASAGTYFGGWTGPVSPISCPDNVAFDSEGNLWISTDGQPSAIKVSDGLFKVPVEGPERGHVQQFLAVPSGAETCGPVIHDRDGSVFVAVQHPGEDGSWATPAVPLPRLRRRGRQRRGPASSPVRARASYR